MRITTLLLTIIFLLYTAPVFAEGTQPAKPQYRSYINGINCSQIVEGLDKESTRKAYVLMVGSFISGSNYAKNRDSKTDLQGMMLLTEQFCRQNPEFPVMTALVFLDKSIDKRINQ